MYEAPPGFETIFQGNRRECLELRLVLNAAGISAEALHHHRRWFLVVNESVAQSALMELSDYRKENPRGETPPARRTQTYAGAGIAVVFYAILLMAVEVMATSSQFGLDWFAAGRMRAEQVTDGQWWRVITALTLHVDIGHILGNLVFGSIFGLLAGRVLGGGVAWLVIVAAGALGNLLNAFVQAGEHSSIGASTGVFAALGILVSHALRFRANKNEKLLKRWSPLIGGVVLFGMTGLGDERTDVLAHVTGFMAGLFLGWLFTRLSPNLLSSRKIQLIAAGTTLLILSLAWIVALRSLS